jgi:hypothetical protein
MELASLLIVLLLVAMLGLGLLGWVRNKRVHSCDHHKSIRPQRGAGHSATEGRSAPAARRPGRPD